MSGPKSVPLTATMSARRSSGDGPGARCRTGSPARMSRRRPCQPTATSASSGGTSAHASGSSPATGPSSHAGAERHSRRERLDRQRRPPPRRPPGGGRRALDVVEHGAAGQCRDAHVHPRLAERGELLGVCGLGIRPDERRDPQPEPGDRQGAIRHGPAEPPAARVVGDPVARCRADHDHARRAGIARAGRSEACAYTRRMFFYELHEGDDEVYSDVILYSNSEWEPDEFFDLVQAVRRRIQDSHTQDTPDRGDRDGPRARARLPVRLRRPAERRGQRVEAGGRQLPGRDRQRAR